MFEKMSSQGYNLTCLKKQTRWKKKPPKETTIANYFQTPENKNKNHQNIIVKDSGEDLNVPHKVLW